jgi:hypothetical protein
MTRSGQPTHGATDRPAKPREDQGISMKTHQPPGPSGSAQSEREAIALPDIRAIALEAIKDAWRAGESHEMCARWISERVSRALFPLPAPEPSGDSAQSQPGYDDSASRDASADAEPSAAWRPIETAPKNEVVVVTDGENAAVSALEDTDYSDVGYWALDGDGGLDWQPTHWMPPPTSDRQGRGEGEEG